MDPRAKLRARMAALLLHAIIGLNACAKPEVSGSVLPVESERSGLPWLRVEVRLLRGTVMEQLSPLAAKHRQAAEDEALQRVLALAKGELPAKVDAAQRARAGVPHTDITQPATAVRACLPTAEAALANAKGNHRAALSDLMPRLAAAGVATNQPEAAIEYLQLGLRSKVASEARRLRDEYLSTQIVQQSGLVLAAGSPMDRLCWTGHNKRDVAVRFRGLTLLYNGRELPPAVAAQLWRLPPREKALRMPGVRGVDNDLLLPGTQYEACFYASRTAVPVDVLNRYGLSTENPNRNGEWRVRWDDIELVDATAANGSSGPARNADSLTAAFGGALRQFETQLEERQLIDALESSASARAVVQAQAALLDCHRAIEKEKAAREVERVIHAIEAGHNDDAAVQARVRPLLEKALHDPARLANWVTEADALIDGATVARQEQNLGGAYRFEDLEPGQYTLLATSAVEADKPKVWVVPLEVKGPVAQDLVASTARDLPLRKTLEQVLLGI